MFKQAFVSEEYRNELCTHNIQLQGWYTQQMLLLAGVNSENGG